jgi:hypothetical protein
LLSVSLFAQVTFVTETSVLPQNRAVSEVFDFNHDGYLDIVVYDWDAQKLKVLVNDKNGGFSVFQEIPTSFENFFAADLQIGDFDGDTYEDILLVATVMDEQRLFKVFKNNSGSNVSMVFELPNVNESDNMLKGNYWHFLDIDDDNDLDIVGGSRIFINNGITFKEPKELNNWIDKTWDNEGFKNSQSFGAVSIIKPHSSIGFANNRLAHYLTVDKRQTINDVYNLTGNIKFTSSIPENRGMFLLDLNNDNTLDIIRLNIGNNNMYFECDIVQNRSTMLFKEKRFVLDTIDFDIPHSTPEYSLLEMAWDVGDIDGNGMVDIAYIYREQPGNKNILNVIYLERLSENSDTIIVKHHQKRIAIEVANEAIFNNGLSLNLADVDNDGDLDIITSHAIYKNTSNLTITAPVKPNISSAQPNISTGEYTINFENTTLNLLFNNVVVTKDKAKLQGICQHLINNHNAVRKINHMFNNKRFIPREEGWHYFSAQAVNYSLIGSEWAEIDSFYNIGNKIIGSDLPCINTKSTYYVAHTYQNIDTVIWSSTMSITPDSVNSALAEVSFTIPGYENITAILMSNNTPVDTLTLKVKVRHKPELNIEFPSKACIGTAIKLKNTGEKIDPSYYSWRIFYSSFSETIENTDSLVYIFPNTTILNVTLQIKSDSNICGFPYTDKVTNSSNMRILKTQPPTVSVTASDIACGTSSTLLKVNERKIKGAQYNWNFDGATVEKNQGDTIVELTWDEGITKNISLVVDENGCISNTAQKAIARKPIPEIKFDYRSVDCHNESAQIKYTGNAASGAQFTWNFDAPKTKTGTGAGPYALTWNNGGMKTIQLSVNAGGCVADSTFKVDVSDRAQKQEICAVSVDNNNHAVILWQRPVQLSVDSVRVYKESSQSNIYKPLKGFGVDEAFSFTDTATNCSSQPYRYKMATRDTCDYESEMGTFHKTIHLMMNKGQNASWNLVWTPYEGAEVTTYSIYRGASLSNMFKIADVSGNVYSFTDQFPPVGDQFYTVAASTANNCGVTTKSALLDPFVIQSNKVNTNIFTSTLGIKHQLTRISSIGMSVNIQTDVETPYYFEVINILGQKVYERENVSGSHTEKLNRLLPGMYIINVKSNGYTVSEKVTLK